ncbi:hypothetical protein VP1G_10727 [Cytospora mali]|uniref:Uncharacterized protein n=1 Tax=Cytospora mali TaxID=578113 RepID=A0A194UVJ8_CYTMA|nr:hypothetical protein VP1G_10727 [Valsa mali var. pyri (nom. inval.)]
MSSHADVNASNRGLSPASTIDLKLVGVAWPAWTGWTAYPTPLVRCGQQMEQDKQAGVEENLGNPQ